MFDLKTISTVADSLKRLADAAEKIVPVVSKIDAIIESVGGVEGIKEKVAFFDLLRQAAAPAEKQDA